MSCHCASKCLPVSRGTRPADSSLACCHRYLLKGDILRGARQIREQSQGGHRSMGGVCFAAAEKSGGEGGDTAELVTDGNPPWSFGFQCNERYLDWDDGAQRRLVQLVASEKLGISLDELAERVASLGVLLPDMVTKLARMKADLLVKLLASPDSVTEKMIVLKEELPDADVSSLVARYPYLIAEFSVAEIRNRIADMRRTLGEGADLSALLSREPRLFSVDLGCVLKEITRLMGDGVDPVSMLLSQPDMVLSMEQSGLPSAIDRDV